ncbi:MAG: hypothetical protein KDC12_14155, partial [Flavobacteriales bacterium]|nr:hypothetical protein [Flavobacteriales bacterium]
MLTVPDKVTIQLTDSDGQPARLDKVLVGIKTFATHKNDIYLSPFLSDKDGRIEITKKDIQDTTDNFISYGIMDYSSLESANPNVEIYLWAAEELDRYIAYWSKLLKSKESKDYENDPLFRTINGQQRETLFQQFRDIAA